MTLKNWWNRTQIKERSYTELRFINRIRICGIIFGLGFIVMLLGAMNPSGDYLSLSIIGLTIIICSFILFATFGSEDITLSLTYSDVDDTESRIP